MGKVFENGNERGIRKNERKLKTWLWKPRTRREKN